MPAQGRLVSERGEPWSRRGPWREGWEWRADSPPPCPGFQQIRSAEKPKGRKAPEEICAEAAEPPKSFPANGSQKHQQSFKSFRRAGQLSVCGNPCSSLLLPGPFPTKPFTTTWDPSRRDVKSFALCYGVTSWETLRSLHKEQRGVSSLSMKHHSLTLKPSFRLTWCQQIYQTFCN